MRDTFPGVPPENVAVVTGRYRKLRSGIHLKESLPGQADGGSRWESCTIPVAVLAERRSTMSLRVSRGKAEMTRRRLKSEDSLLNGSGRLREYDQEYAANSLPFCSAWKYFKSCKKER